MSAKTIRLYQEHTGKRPSDEERDREIAAQLRRYAAGILARAQEIEESADRRAGK